MNTWLVENSMVIVIVLAVACAALSVAALALLVAWLVTRRSRHRDLAGRIRAERDRLAVELALAEQTGRLRIIRELHEVTVHDMSVIIGQADGARYAGESDPGAAVRSVAVMGEAARAALADLRRVMTVVHEGESDVEGLPQASLTELIAVMSDAGLRITVEETGERYDLKPAAELAMYSILQEALSNALTHGGDGTTVTVALTWTEVGFQLRVDDDGVRNELRRSGRNPNDPAQHRPAEIDDDLMALTGVVSGAGITGMRERTELFGGFFTSTRNTGVGFSISASFPSLRYHNGVHGVNLDHE